MALPVDADGPTWKLIALGAWVVVTALFSWAAQSLRNEQKEQRANIVAAHKRLDDTVTKDDFKDALGIFRSERDAQHKDNRDERVRLHEETLANFKELSNKLDTQAVQDQRILQLERDLAILSKYSEDVKHLSVDPYVRETAVLKSRVDAIEASRRTP
jgi:hypothetical protein